MKNTFIILVTLLIPAILTGQNIKDTTRFIPSFSANMMVQMPGGDLADRYGVSTAIGATFSIKLKNNISLEIGGNYLFGNQLRGDASSLFDSILTDNGTVINENGEYAKIRTFERGYSFHLRAGYILPLLQVNKNSGILIMAGGGLLQHKIRIENDGNNTPQILGDYKKGYDKMCLGPSLNEFIGYVYYSPNQLMNFYAGFEFTQAWTKSQRSFDYSLFKKDDRLRLDLLNAFRIGWVIPLYKRAPDPYYFN